MESTISVVYTYAVRGVAFWTSGISYGCVQLVVFENTFGVAMQTMLYCAQLVEIVANLHGSAAILAFQ